MSNSLRRLDFDRPAAAAMNDPDVLHLHAYLEYAVGDFEEADKILRQAILLNSHDARFYFDLGLINWRLNDIGKALEGFTRAASLDPNYADAFYNAAVIETRQGNGGNAGQLYRRAFQVDPLLRLRWVRGYLRTRFLGETSPLLGRHGWRIPTRDFPEVLDAIAYGLMKRGELEKAIATCERALSVAPTAKRHAAAGLIYTLMELPKAALPHLQKSMQLDPTSEQVAEMLAFSLDQTKNFTAAKELYEDIVEKNPRAVLSISRLLLMATIEGRFDDAEMNFARLVKAIEYLKRDPSSRPWEQLSTIAYRAIMWPLPPDLAHALSRGIDDQLNVLTRKRGGYFTTPGSIPRRHDRIRIGYLSANLRDHPIGHVTEALFRAHDRAKFEVHVFYAFANMNSYTKSISADVEHFHTVTGKLSETAKLIKDEEIDILIYLDGYMSHRLMQIVAWRPAPVQLYWLGHAGGCELSSIDYIIADKVVIPSNEETRYRAKVIRLPDTYHCASPHPIGRAPTRRAAGLPDLGFVFCAFNNPEKITKAIFEIWMQILQAVEGSVLWLSASANKNLPSNLRAVAEAQGIAGDRLIFAERIPDKAVHFARHELCGLLLDTISLNASTTALDALWAGLPVLTVRGDRFASRIATSMLTAIGLADLVCETLEEYKERAIFLAQNPVALDELKTRLKANRETHPLFKPDVFCRNLEEALEAIYDIHLKHAETESATK